MNAEEQWTLEPWHVRAAFRKAHVNVPEHTFSLPQEKITGPDMELEGKEFYITVTVSYVAFCLCLKSYKL
jgi:large subunit ribosomal protein L9